MAEKLQVVDVSADEATARPADATTLWQDVLVRIRRDSAEGSQEYLDETNVPHGGE